MYAFASYSTGEWFSDMHAKRSETEIYTQALLTAKVLEQIYGE